MSSASRRLACRKGDFDDAVKVANALLMFPTRTRAPGQCPEVQAMLQGFCWTEATFQDDLASRNSHLAGKVKVLLPPLHAQWVREQAIAARHKFDRGAFRV